MRDPVWDRLYPELGSVDGFLVALERACSRVGTSVAVSDTSSDEVFTALLTDRGEPVRTSRVSVHKTNRGFGLQCFEEGEIEVHGSIDDLVGVASSARRWHDERLSPLEFVETPRLVVASTAAFRIFGDVPETYWWIPLQPFSWADPLMRPPLEIARDTPALRKLVPILSMNDLLFSSCTHNPYSVRVPWVRLARRGSGHDEPLYEVRTGPRRLGVGNDISIVVGSGDAPTAIELVANGFPSDLPATITGTAHDIDPGKHTGD